MSGIEKYQRKTICEIPNFANHWENEEHYVSVDGLVMAGPTINWEFFMIKTSINNTDHIKIMFDYGNALVKPEKVGIRVFVNPLNRKKSEKYKWEGKFYWNSERNDTSLDVGVPMKLENLLNPKKGWLDENGTFKIEYGVYVESIQDSDGIWNFNFHEIPFDSMTNCIALHDLKEDKYRFFQKQLLLHHSSVFTKQCEGHGNVLMRTERGNRSFEHFEQMMQIAHGVRLQLSYRDLFFVANYGERMKNVVSYCETRLKTYNYPPRPHQIRDAFNYRLGRYSSYLLSVIESSNELKMILEDVNIQRMSGEGMKQCAMFFFNS